MLCGSPVGVSGGISEDKNAGENVNGKGQAQEVPAGNKGSIGCRIRDHVYYTLERKLVPFAHVLSFCKKLGLRVVG